MKELIDLQRALHVPKDLKGHKYDYRKVDGILYAVKQEAPTNVYIVMTDEPVCIGAFNYIKATVTIYNGKEFISASSSAKEGQLPGQSDPQISGSCSTYARKKALEGLLMLDDNNDPDAIEKKSKDLTVASPEQIKLLEKCVLMLETNGMHEKSTLLKTKTNDKTTVSAFNTLYEKACEYLGQKVEL